MVHRFLAWVGASVVTAGVAAAMIAGAGLAVAEDGSVSGGTGGTASVSSSSSGSKDDSKQAAPANSLSSATGSDSRNDGARGSSADASAAEAPKSDTDVQATGRRHVPFAGEADTDPAADTGGTRVDPPTVTAGGDAKSDSGAAGTSASPARVTRTRNETVAVETEPTDAAESQKTDTDATSSQPTALVELAPVVGQRGAEEPTAMPAVTAVAVAAPLSPMSIDAEAAASPLSGLLSVVGTIVFNLYALATNVIGGPPVLPPNSTVTVRSSTLRIDCADGYEVPADWYFPNGAELNPPQRLIYLQHGFLARGPWYSYTAAVLAEQTNSIVVAPSITSNFLSCDGCWLGGPPMHRAVANLFEDDNAALAESALAAGYSGPIPDRVVLVGHSAGGGLAAGTAGYMVDNHTIDRLAGVVMLDGVGLDGSMVTSIARVPEVIPIYQLAAPKYVWNQDGVGSAGLVAARPDRFVGVTLVGGSHVDAMRGGNPLIQFAQQLVTGFSSPQNVAAAQILMVGWVNDMFAGNSDDGIYAFPSAEIIIDTPVGKATALALPNTLTKPFPLNFASAFVPRGNGLFNSEPACVAESVGPCSGSLAA